MNKDMEFACTKLAPEKIIRCAFGLTKQEFEIFLFLCSQPQQFTSKELQGKFKVNLATVQRALKKFSDADLVLRTQVNYDVGGYEFHYELRSRPHLRKILNERLRHWVSGVEKEVIEWSKNKL